MDEEASNVVQVDELERKERFLKKVLQNESMKSSHFYVLSEDKYLELILQVEEAEKAQLKTPLQKRRLNRFAVLHIGSIKKLVTRNQEKIKFYVQADELFDVIDAAHKAVGHCGRDRILKQTSLMYANITREMVTLYISMCVTCQGKKTKRKKDLIGKPILHSEILNSRCQVDLIDFQTQPDGNCKFIMVYQDHSTKFVLLRALESKQAEEVAFHLNDIFSTIGAPCILQSDNGKEFVNRVLCEMLSLWPELKLINGNPQHSESQDSIERTAQDIENMIGCWLKENQTTKWSLGLRKVQFMKNTAFHTGINQSPYKAMFGFEPRVGLSTFASVLPESMKNIKDEDDFRELIEHTTKSSYIDSDDNTDASAETSKIGDNILKARQTAAENLQTHAKKLKIASDKSHRY